MQSGRTLWDELVHKYSEGVEAVRRMQQTWNSMEGVIDQERFEHVKALLEIQERDAVRWRDTCLAYFQSFSGMPYPEGYEEPRSEEHTSELQSRGHLVCRLLLEKKKKSQRRES